MTKGKILHAGKEVEVQIEIKDGGIIVYFPAKIDTTNWYHAVTIKKISK